MAKIEAAIKEAILRGARKQVRLEVTRLRREVRRLRRALGGLRREMAGLREVGAQWQRVAQAGPWTPQVSDAELRAARLSPRLIQKLRARLGVSQAALSRLVGVSTGAVVTWERGRASPSEQNRRGLVGLRKLGRRDVKRLLATLRKTSTDGQPRRASSRRAPSRRRRRAARRRR